MTKRVTIVFDDDLMKKMRLIQSKQIKRSQSFVSFSKIVNQLLKKG